MDDKIRSIINSTSPISSNSYDKVSSLIEYTSVKRGDLITSVGKYNSSEYFLLNGICKSFLYTPEGEDVTLSFYMPNSVIAPCTTRVKEGKSIFNLRALTDIELGVIDAKEFENLMIEDLEIRQFGNTVLRNELMSKVQKEISLASQKAKERLQLLRSTFPNLENLIPHSDIASYLGVTTISLSRLRANS